MIKRDLTKYIMICIQKTIQLSNGDIPICMDVDEYA